MSTPDQQPGPSGKPPFFDELPIPKLLDLAALVARRNVLAAQGRKVVLTNGCFDLLHAGHIYFLQQASTLGNELFVALNSDASARSLKGPKRPIQTEKERAYALAALACTGSICIFRQPRLTMEIKALRPDIYVKAGDYTLETLDAGERSALVEAGTEIRFLPYLTGIGSTDLIRRVEMAGVALHHGA